MNHFAYEKQKLIIYKMNSHDLLKKSERRERRKKKKNNHGSVVSCCGILGFQSESETHLGILETFLLCSGLNVICPLCLEKK